MPAEVKEAEMDEIFTFIGIISINGGKSRTLVGTKRNE
jgi:hypothetical protein